MPSQEVLTLLIDAKNLASKELVGLQKDLRKASEDSDRLGLVMGRLGTVAKAGLAGGLALAAKGAMDLSDVQARLQAETGASAEEAHNMARAVNEIAGATATAMPNVSSAFSKVVTDLGLTGESAAETTRLFVDFAKVTGQDAASAVTAMDDVLDAWGLQASDARSVMDRLIVSHQRFGGSVQQSTSVLSQLAPAMTAANMSMDDAIGLLNLFNAKGIESEVAVRALQTALTKVQSPEQLKTMIADIAATADGMDRAQKAADLFGAKGGAKLGAALAGANLDEFAISATDAADATQKAGDAIASSFPEQIRRAISGAQAALTGFGDTFGPALTSVMASTQIWATVSSTFGVSLSGAIKTAVEGTVVEAALAAAGKKIAFGLGAAIAAAPFAIGLGVVVAVQEALRDLFGTRKMFADIAEADAKRSSEAVQGAAVATATLMGDTFAETFAGSTARNMPPIGSAIGEGVSAPAVAAVADAAKTVAEKAGGMMDEVASRIRTARSDILAAMRTAMGGAVAGENAELQITVNKAEIAAQKKILASSKYSAAEKAQAQIRINNLRTENATLEIEAALASGDRKKIAEAAAKALKKAMASEDPVIKQNWLDLHKKLKDELEKTAAAAEKYGQKTAENYAAGLGSKYAQKLVQDRAITIAEKAADALKTFSPSKVGPFSKGRGPEDMGLRLGELWAKGLAESGSAVGRSAEKIATTAARPLGGPPAVGLRTGRASATAMAHAAPVTLTVNSTFPPTNAQVAGWVDLIDREMRRRQPRYSAYATGV